MIRVHPRVHDRHPNVSDDDAIHAWRNAIVIKLFDTDESGERLRAVGPDQKGRMLEMTAVELANGDVFIFHAMTPPAKKTYKELGIGKGLR